MSLLGANVLKTKSIQGKSTVSAIESELGITFSDSQIDEHRDRILAILKKKRFSAEDERVLMENLIWPLSKHFSILKRSANSGGYTKAYKKFHMLLPFEDDDFDSILWIFIMEKRKQICKGYRSDAQRLSTYIANSAAYYIRDRFTDSYRPNLSIPRTRNDDSKKIKELKVMAASLISSLGDEEKSYLDSIESESDTALVAEHKKLANILIDVAPLIFSRLFLGLSQEEHFVPRNMSAKTVSSEASELKEKVGEEEALAIKKASSSRGRASNGITRSIDWTRPNKDLVKKATVLLRIGISDDNIVKYLSWLKNNKKRLTSASKVL